MNHDALFKMLLKNRSILFGDILKRQITGEFKMRF